jgi:hypothetical protein
MQKPDYCGIVETSCRDTHFHCESNTKNHASQRLRFGGGAGAGAGAGTGGRSDEGRKLVLNWSRMAWKRLPPRGAEGRPRTGAGAPPGAAPKPKPGRSRSGRPRPRPRPPERDLRKRGFCVKEKVKEKGGEETDLLKSQAHTC